MLSLCGISCVPLVSLRKSLLSIRRGHTRGTQAGAHKGQGGHKRRRKIRCVPLRVLQEITCLFTITLSFSKPKRAWKYNLAPGVEKCCRDTNVPFKKFTYFHSLRNSRCKRLKRAEIRETFWRVLRQTTGFRYEGSYGFYSGFHYQKEEKILFTMVQFIFQMKSFENSIFWEGKW